jgi:hypothetical protein
MILRCVLILLAIILASVTAAAESYPQVADYELEASFIPDKSFMTGLARIYFEPGETPAKEVTFYLHSELRVDSVLLNGRTLEVSSDLVSYDYNYSLVALKTTLDLSSPSGNEPLVVYYHGYFHPNKSASISNYMRIDQDGVFLRSYGYSLWFPVFLEHRKDWYRVNFRDVKITTPRQFHTVFVGHHVGDDIVGESRISSWQALDTEIFSAQCTSQKFEITSEGDFHAYHWNDSVSREPARAIIKKASELNELFRTRYKRLQSGGQYYFMQMPRYADISSDNVTGIFDKGWKNFATDNRAIGVLAHEMLHPFVRVDVSRTDRLFALMIEGFPSYFDRPIYEHLWGEQWAYESLLKLENRYLTARATGRLPNGLEVPAEKAIDQITAEEIGIYKDLFVLPDRATLFMNFLRVRMGKEGFDRFALSLFNDGPMNSDRFLSLIGEFAPDSNADVEVWLSTTDYPERFHISNLMSQVTDSN